MKNKRIFSYIKPYKKIVIIVFLLLSVFLVSQSLIPLLVGRYINNFAKASFTDKITLIINYNQSELTKYIILISSLLLFGSVSCFFYEYYLAIFVQNVIANIRLDIYRKINSLSISKIEGKTVGEYVQFVISDVENISLGISSFIKQLLQGILRILITTIIMFCTNWFLSICVIVLSPLSLFVSKFVAKYSYKSFNITRDNTSNLTSYSVEATNNISLIQSLNNQEESSNKFESLNNSLKKSSVMSQFSSSWTNPVTRLINGLIYSLVGISGIVLVYYNLFSLGIGDVSAFLTYTNGYTKPFNDISSVIGEFEAYKVAMNKIDELLDNEDDIDSTKKLDDKIKSVEFKDLSFSYDGNKDVLSDISFSIKEKEKVALVGQTGSGKTTLVSLLLRFYEPTKGTILFNNNDINSINKKSLRSHIGMVLQDSWIFNGTIKENINYCGTNNENEVYNICNEIKANSFIETMKDKYDTHITSNSSLSDGQKQIITIARVLLDQNDLIILDEATSNIDTLSEKIIHNAFNSLTKDKTSIIIAHRLSTITSCDKIIALNDGKIVEIGSHKQLLKNKGYYYQLYNSQFK